jgi:alanine-glyoxylate transaminase/serine-glyoxylate transaminase/serine-pyruvate transaminase
MSVIHELSMETCFANLVEPGDKVVVCINGVFGMRMQENITRFGGVAVVVEDDFYGFLLWLKRAH